MLRLLRLVVGIILLLQQTLAHTDNVLQPSFPSYMEVNAEPDSLVFGAALASSSTTTNNNNNNSLTQNKSTSSTGTTANITSLIRYDVRCPNDCSENGWCNPTNGVCVCGDGRTGAACDQHVCPHDCNGNGRCENGTCVCSKTWYGVDCSVRGCEVNNCNDRGVCENGLCVSCIDGWEGVHCDQERGCVNSCSGHGTCHGGQCYCHHGYTGPGCEQKECPHACNGHGTCDVKTGKCSCLGLYVGESCDQLTCPQNCLDHGICNATTGTCNCYPGYYGIDCDAKNCKNDCSKQGKCVYDAVLQRGQCECDAQWTGDGCDEPMCPQQCSGHGNCTTKGCLCGASWAGRDCSIRTCPRNCSGATHGFCNNATFECTCLNGWGGDACDERLCPDDCNFRGACNNGTCVCSDLWTGSKCEIPQCPKNERGIACDSHGECVLPTITNSPAEAMNAAFNQSVDHTAQAIASTRSLTTKHQDEAYCKCSVGWGGRDCSVKLCKNDCSGHGICSFGQCFCRRGYFGTDCSLEAKVEKKRIEHEAAVLNAPLVRCQERCAHGKCMYVPKPVMFKDVDKEEKQKFVVHHTYDCFCIGDWGGENCTVPLHACPKGCYDAKTGKCIQGCLGDGACHAVDGLSCAGHGKCIRGVCHCERPWAGPACELASCPKNCNGQGYCNTARRKCLCNAGWAGDACDIKLRTDERNL